MAFLSSLRSFFARPWPHRFALAAAWAGILTLVLGAVGWFVFARDLPSVDQLRTYEPPLPTNIRGADGMPLQSYARERRVELAYGEYPKTLIQAYLSAEDKTFFSHHGVDYPGIVSAVIDNLFSGKRARGASTITQQVAKNLLVGNERSYARKVREAILAWRTGS